MTPSIPEHTVSRLQHLKSLAEQNSEIQRVVAAKDQVIARYSQSFQPGAVETLDEEVMRSFLLFKNNCHWTGLHRQSGHVCADMAETRRALAEAVDRSRPLDPRLDRAQRLHGMGKGILTAILHVAYPDDYGVWNNVAESALKQLGVMPAFPYGSSFGRRYRLVNNVLLGMADAINVDLWTLDIIWWKADGHGDSDMRAPVQFPDPGRQS